VLPPPSDTTALVRDRSILPAICRQITTWKTFEFNICLAIAIFSVCKSWRLCLASKRHPPSTFNSPHSALFLLLLPLPPLHTPPPSNITDSLAFLLSVCFDRESKHIGVAKGQCLTNTLSSSPSLLEHSFRPCVSCFRQIFCLRCGMRILYWFSCLKLDWVYWFREIIIISTSSAQQHRRGRGRGRHHHHHYRHHHHHHHHRHRHRHLAARHHGAIGPARQYERPDECCDGMLKALTRTLASLRYTV